MRLSIIFFKVESMNYPERYLNWQCLQMNRNQLPHPISHSEINQSLYDLPSSGLIVFEVLVVCLVNRSRGCYLWVEMSGEGRL